MLTLLGGGCVPGMAATRLTGEDGGIGRNVIQGAAVLYVFGFEQFAVVVGDLYFVDPNPHPGQEGAEHGVRLEVRLLRQGELKGSMYSARPIEVGQPVWRADLLEAVDGPPGSLNRAHHHPGFHGWEPGKRVFDENLSADPVGWVGEQLSDLEALAERAGVPAGAALVADAESVRGSVADIKAAVRVLLDKIKAGELAAAPDGGQLASARISWL